LYLPVEHNFFSLLVQRQTLGPCGAARRALTGGCGAAGLSALAARVAGSSSRRWLCPS